MKKVINLQLCRGKTLTIVCLNDSAEIEIWADKNGIDIGDKVEFDGLFAKFGDNFNIVIHKNTSHGNIAHECTHFLNTFYKSINQQLDTDNDELYCHILGYFVDEIIELQDRFS